MIMVGLEKFKKKVKKVSKLYMYAHGGSGNHGCEAIVRSTLKILENLKEEKELFSTRPEEDKKYGIYDLCTVIEEKKSYSKKSLEFIKAYMDLKLKNNYVPMDKLAYRKAISKVQKGDIALSIGGDNYCYLDNNRYIMLQDLFLERGAKTVLWGCSVEPDLVKRPEIANDLKRYSLITARESISYNALKDVNPNTILVADPAFMLDKKEIFLPKELENQEFVGINLSPMIVENEANNGITIKNYEKLIEYILKDTNLSIMLVPHVVWEFNDDRVPLKKLYEKYKESKRILLLDDMSCESIKGYIAKCKFFIGARTHSTIAAYSSCVPTLVVGYSVKAIGIARDLFGTEENYVIPVQNLQEEVEVLNHFKWLYDNEKEIRDHLRMTMEKYKMKSLYASDAVKGL